MEHTAVSEKLIAALNSQVHGVKSGFPRDAMKEYPYRFHPTVRNKSGQRIVPILDAIPNILVSKKEDEIAAALRVSDSGLDLYLSSNGTDLDAAKDHLLRVWSSLREIKEASENRLLGQELSFTTDRSSTLRDKLDDLLRLIYDFSIESLILCFEKDIATPMRNFIFGVEDGEEYITRPGDLEKSVWLTQDEVKLLLLFRYVYLKVDEYKSEGSEQGRKKKAQALAQHISKSRAYIELKDNERLENGRMALTSAEDTSFYSRCTSILQNGFQVRVPDAFRRFWDEVFTLDHSYRDLLHLSQSSSMDALIHMPLSITIVPNGIAHQRILKYDLQTDSDLSYILNGDADRADRSIIGHDESVSGDPESSSEIIEPYHAKLLRLFKTKDMSMYHDGKHNPHSACQLLAYLLNHKIQAFPYVGNSKLVCIGCWLYFQSQNDVAIKNFFPMWYDIRGSENRTSEGWVKPHLQNEKLAQCIETELTAKGRRQLIDLLFAQ
ncbi:hypothetical protein ACEPAI_7590 [Sanghuangporus weigelae]